MTLGSTESYGFRHETNREKMYPTPRTVPGSFVVTGWLKDMKQLEWTFK